MGVVWLGRDEVLGRAVALKRIGMFPGGSHPDIERAAREARLAASLNHPHVVAVFDLVSEGDEQWLVMEYVEGTTLAGLVRREGPLPADRAARVIGQAADALAAAHTAGIVHRDVKPSNMLITTTGLVKLTDFGIARAVADASLTQTGMVTGSPAYLAPEIAAGRTATAASDVWSLGASLYFALAGEPPYEVGGNVLGALYRIVHEDPPRLPDAGWLVPALESTMDKEPEARWTMAHLRDALAAGPQAVEAPEPAPDHTRILPVAGPVTAPEPPPEEADQRQPQRQPRTEPVAEPVAEPVTAPVTGPRTEPGPVAPPEAPAAPPEPRGGRRRRPWLVPALVALAAVLLVGLVTWAALRGDDEQPAANSGGGETTSTPSPSSSPTSSPTKQEPTEAEMTSFVDDYLATVTEDPATTWKRLTPGFQDQSGGFGAYRRFWSGFESATPGTISADPKAMTVSYDVDYVRKDGGRSSDNVTLQLVEQDGDLLIDGER